MNNLMNENYINDLHASGIIKDKQKSIYMQRIENYRISVQKYYYQLSELKKKNSNKDSENNNLSSNDHTDESEHSIINHISR